MAGAMKRGTPSAGLSRDASRLARLAASMQAAGSQIEREGWRSQILTLVVSLFQKKQNETLEQVLDFLWEDNPPACDLLSELVEGYSETLTEAADSSAVLVAIPLLAWSRYSILSGAIGRQRLLKLRELLQRHLFAENVQLSIADHIYSPDQLPRGFVETRQLLVQLAALTETGQDLPIDAERLPQSGEFVADVRYVFACARLGKHAPLFRWQQADTTRDEVEEVWRTEATALFSAVMPGSHVRVLLPDAFFSAWRKLEREARPYSLRAAVNYLCESLSVLPAELRAIIAPCANQTLEEYRIGFSLLKDARILHGVVWPLVGDESEESELLPQIERELSDLGKVVVLGNTLPLEYCDDCGIPLFPDAEGDLVHPEMPEVAGTPPQLH